MTRYATELIFISRIKRDGSGVEMVTSEEQKKLESCTIGGPYELMSLSITNGTFIAGNISLYVVKLKNPPYKQ